MVMSPLGLGIKNEGGGEGQQQFTLHDLISYSNNFLFVLLYCSL
jgi:hypothetical protein